MTDVLAVTAPSVEYGLLSPMLIVFGVAVAGVARRGSWPRGVTAIRHS